MALVIGPRPRRLTGEDQRWRGRPRRRRAPRPTVSTAIARLIAEQKVERRPDGTWLLRGEPVGLPAPGTARFVPRRRPGASIVH